MQNIRIRPLGLALLGGTLCAASPRVTWVDPVGPDSTLKSNDSREGSFEVYSARERTPVNFEEFLWNTDAGQNEFLHASAHTRYAIYGADGRLVKRVINATDRHDAQPTRVELRPGVYRVEAAAEAYNDVTFTVMVPTCIKPGLTTAIHLDGKWRPAASRSAGELVHLPNGHLVGWRSPSHSGASQDAAANGGPKQASR